MKYYVVQKYYYTILKVIVGYTYLICSPNIIVSVLLVLTLHALKLVFNTGLSKDGTSEEGNKSFKGVRKMFRRYIKVKVGVF